MRSTPALLILGLVCAASLAFTGQQAFQGEALFAAHCAVCHGPYGQGGKVPAAFGSLRFLEAPPLVGQAATTPKYGTAANLLAYISGNMPAQAPGVLAPEHYLQIVACLLRAAGLPPGGEPLTAQSAAGVYLNPGEAAEAAGL